MLNMRSVIVSGKSTSIWFDPWLGGAKLIDHLGRANVWVEKLTVSRLIHNKHWHLSHSALTQLWRQIQKTEFTDTHAQTQDSWNWIGSSSGQYAFYAVWEFCKLTWFTGNCPKMGYLFIDGSARQNFSQRQTDTAGYIDTCMFVHTQK